MSDSTDLICVTGLVKSYRGNAKRALDGVSFSVAEGECFGLIGPNGAGKTTLMSCLLALIKPDQGQITIAGIAPNDLSVREITGFLPERPNFESFLTGFEFMTLHHMLTRRPAKERKAEIEQALETVGLESSSWRRKIETYSRGMLQRLGLAQAIVGRPNILFLDEPGSGMDPPGISTLRQLFFRFKQEGITVVLNSHHLDEMERVCDRVAFIKGGKIQAIEKLGKSADAAHILMVRWHSKEGEPPERVIDLQLLTALAGENQSVLAERGDDWARFGVANSDVAAKLIRALVACGVPVCAALPEYATLERLFSEAAADPGDKIDDQ